MTEKTVSELGDIWQIGEHRVLCGSSTDAIAVSELMEGEKASLLFTSPPYDNQRTYKIGAIDWTSLMTGVCKNIPGTEDVQILINLGMIHRDYEWQPYWDTWLKWITEEGGYRRFGLYIWDQGAGLPGDWNGRLAPAFEFVFHFNKVAKRPNKIIPCVSAGKAVPFDKRGASAQKSGADAVKWTHAGTLVQDFRIPDSIIHINRKATSGIEKEHPAVFPVEFPEFIIRSYSNEGDIVYEPFAGSGTTMIAAEKQKRKCRCIELSPEYVDIILRRWLVIYPKLYEVINVNTGESFVQVATRKGIEIPDDRALYRPDTGTKRKEPISTLGEFL